MTKNHSTILINIILHETEWKKQSTWVSSVINIFYVVLVITDKSVSNIEGEWTNMFNDNGYDVSLY